MKQLNEHTKYAVLKTFFNSYKRNHPFTRRELMQFLKTLNGVSEEYADQTCLLFRRAGYVEKIGIGLYVKRKVIPNQLSLHTLQQQAYPNAKWRNK